jgi:diguanylate cyclase (GGDEF)-like protein
VLTLINALQPLYIVNILVGLTLAFCLCAVAFGRDRDLLFWAAGFGLFAVAFTLFGLRNEIPSIVSVVGGNGAMALMFAMFTEGLCRLYGFRLSRWLIWTAPLLAVVGFGWFHDEFERRIALGVVVSLYHSVLVMYLIIRSLFVSFGRGRWIIFSAVAAYAVMFLIRAGLVMSGASQGDSFLTPGLEQSVYFSIATVSSVMFAIGLLVVYKERAESAAWHQAHHDPLTAVGNRRVLKQRLQALSGRRSNGHDYSALLLLDLDHFKDLNDGYGHALGDQLLVHVADRLRRSISHSDAVVRLGGDEFVVVLDQLGSEQANARERAALVAQRILQQICQPYLLELSADPGHTQPQIEYKITASIGVAVFFSHSFSHEDVLRAADIAMYKAKQAGRNTFYMDLSQRLNPDD